MYADWTHTQTGSIQTKRQHLRDFLLFSSSSCFNSFIPIKQDLRKRFLQLENTAVTLAVHDSYLKNHNSIEKRAYEMSQLREEIF